MTAKSLAILAGVAGVIAVGAYLVATSRSGGVSSEATGGGALVFPDLAGKGDSVTAISVRTGGQETLVHKLDKGAWGISSRDDYPADVEKIRKIVQDLAQAKIAEAKTSKPELYERLGVQDADAKDSKSTLLTLKAGDAPVASIIIGNTPATRGDNPMAAPLPGVFARKAGDAQAVLLDKAIELPTGAAGWMKTDVLSLDGQRVNSAVFKQSAEPGGESKDGQPPSGPKPEEMFTLVKDRPSDPGFSVASMPAGRTLRTPTAPAPIATVLSYVTIDDAAAAKVVDGLTPVSVGTFKTFDGLVVESKLFVKDSKNWLTLAASYEAPPMPEVPAEATKDESKKEEGKPDEGKKDEIKPADPKVEAEKKYKETAEKVQKEVADLNARLKPWAFQIPDFKAKQIRTRLEDLLAPPVETPATGDAPGQPAAPQPSTPLIFPQPK